LTAELLPGVCWTAAQGDPAAEDSRLEPSDRKALGAFYTSEQVAQFLVWWGIRSGRETILDPCFGGGVFIDSACRRLLALGGNPREQMYGIEVDARAHASVAPHLEKTHGILPSHLLRTSFFDIEPEDIPPPDVVVGNPPFIRYQKFKGVTRARAQDRARAQGVKLSDLTSSWAPFLVHCIALLKHGGRLAMVIPAELGHASYAAPVINHLLHSFRSVTFLTFQERLFPRLSQDTILLLGEGKGEPNAALLWRDFADCGCLRESMESRVIPLSGTRCLDRRELVSGQSRLIHQYLPARAIGLYKSLAQSDDVTRLGDIADIGIGYVTGANSFFHLNDVTATKYAVPEHLLRRAVRRGRDLVGLRFTDGDWQSLRSRGDGVFLLSLDRHAIPRDGVLDYLRLGERLGIHRRYKCRTRSPWYCVPNVYQADGFLSYMSGLTPRLVSNRSGAVAPNSLHVIRLLQPGPVSVDSLAALWQTSLTRLSCELEGHSLGGGMLKLEPGEAERVLIPVWRGDAAEIDHLGDHLDRLYRAGRGGEALECADREILQGLGLSVADIALLKSASEALQVRRCRGGMPNGSSRRDP